MAFINLVNVVKGKTKNGTIFANQIFIQIICHKLKDKTNDRIVADFQHNYAYEVN